MRKMQVFKPGYPTTADSNDSKCHQCGLYDQCEASKMLVCLIRLGLFFAVVRNDYDYMKRLIRKMSTEMLRSELQDVERTDVKAIMLDDLYARDLEKDDGMRL